MSTQPSPQDETGMVLNGHVATMRFSIDVGMAMNQRW